MPISEERMVAIRAEARAAQMAAMKEAATAGSVAGSLVLPKAGSVPANPDGVTLPNPQGERPGEFISRVARGSDDAVRQVANKATFGAADAISSALPGGGTLDEERQRTRAARQRLGPEVAGMADMAGGVLQGMALPGAAFASIPRAAGTAALTSLGNEVGGALGAGTPVPSMTDLTVDAGVSALAGGLGKYLGDRLGNLWARTMTENAPTDQNLYKQAAKQVSRVKEQIDSASLALDSSKVTIRPMFLTKQIDSIEKGLMAQRAYRQDLRPAAKSAVETFRKYVGGGGDVTLPELNEARVMIRNSVLGTDGAILDGIEYADVSMVRAIDRKIGSIISDLDKTPAAVGSGNVKQGVDAWKKINELTPVKYKASLLAGAIDKADLASKGTGTTFDRTLQAQFRSLYNSKLGRAEFKGEDLVALRNLAEGTATTQMLNRLDKKYGHGLLSQVYNTLNTVPRAGTSKAAAEAARGVLNKTAPTVPVQSPTRIPGQLGAVVGTVGADQAVDQARKNLQSQQQPPEEQQP